MLSRSGTAGGQGRSLPDSCCRTRSASSVRNRMRPSKRTRSGSLLTVRDLRDSSMSKNDPLLRTEQGDWFPQMRPLRILTLIFGASSGAALTLVAQRPATPATQTAPILPAPNERAMEAHLRFLASDLLEGR